jgi:FlaA1/EpsC-like NDP-sugar epimerase
MRNRHFLLLDLLLLALAPTLALLVRFEGTNWPAGLADALVAYTAITLPLRIIIAWRFGLYRTLWQHASITEVARILGAAGVIFGVLLCCGLALLQWKALAPTRMPLSTVLMDALLTVAVLGTPRLAVRLAEAVRRRDLPGKRTIIVGAGVAGQAVLREMQSSRHATHRIVGFVDDDEAKIGQELNGVRVEGRINELPRVIRNLGASDVIIAMPSARGAVVRCVVDLATQAGARTRIVPSLSDIVSGRVNLSAIRPVEIDDLLRRAPIVTDLDAVRTLITGKVVVVTGAGGSIGSELCRQIGPLAPSLLVVLDHAENQVFEIQQELRLAFPTVPLAPIVADIRNAARVRETFARFRPHAVFHAAAHKHVPLMEDNVVEAVTNNVLGTRNVVDAAVDTNVEHFVLISTDKAVRPTSIMGASKRLAETIVRTAAEREQRHFVVVRFGNVLGSRGSVVPTFLAQLARGGPLTVTHPDMRRYFMTIPEAVQLVLQAGALGAGGELFVLDMGDPVRIADLARDLIRLSGLEEGADIEIQYTGMRPGEKLYEEVLFGTEDVQPTDHPKVLRVLAESPDASLDGQIRDLILLAQATPRDDAALRAALIQLIPDFIGADRAPVIPRPAPLPAERKLGA